METAFYRMRNNIYMGDCIAIVCKLNENELNSSFTRNELIVFIKVSPVSFGNITDINKLKNSEDIFGNNKPILRIGSECMFGMFGDSHCDCEPERRSMLRLLNERWGIYIHLPQEAQGMGLSYKAKELQLQVSGFKPDGTYIGQLSQSEAAEILTGDKIIDNRSYSVVSDVLNELNLLKYTYELVSKNSSKIDEARSNGIKVSSIINSSTVMTADNLGEHLAKWWEKSYLLTDEDILHIINILKSSEIELPPRAVNILNEIRFTLETDENKILKKINIIDEKIRKEFIDSLHNPINPSVLGSGQLQMWSLLERAEAYHEYQYELILTKELDNYLVQKCTPEGQVRLWHEINYYFYPPYHNSSDSRDLKIRLTYDMNENFIAGHLIHKIKSNEHFYQIRTINFSDPAMFDLIRQTVFKDYDQEVIESITYPYCYPDRGMKIIIKKYADGQRTLSLEGKQVDVVSWKNTAQDAINKLIIQVEQNNRSFAPKIKTHNLKFNVEQFMKDEFANCRRYFNYD